jgi:mono/diheme cytochrome c family protein
MRARFPWRAVLVTVIAAYGAVFLAALLVYSGAYAIAATDAHWGVTRWVVETARRHSIEAHAAGIAPPPGIADPARLPIGVEHFAAHCAVCHGAPGVPRGDIAAGMYPLPPDLRGAAGIYSDAERFWILRHGIKMTGIPAWTDHSDEDLWAIVAFLRQLPAISEQDYARLIMANAMHGVTHKHGEAEAATPDPSAGDPVR